MEARTQKIFPCTCWLFTGEC